MLAAFRLAWRAVQHLNARGYIYIWGNLLWVVASLPILTLPAAWFGLVRLSQAAQDDPGVTLSEFFTGFRENLWRGVVLALLNLLIISVNLSNLIVYQQAAGGWAAVLRVVWVLALLLWFSIQFYAIPLLSHMESPTLWGALRNGAVMVALNPLFTLGLWAVIIPIILLSTILTASWLLLTGSVLAALTSMAVKDRLDRKKRRVLTRHESIQ